MSISVACPNCGRQYNVKDDAAGKTFKCKDCDAHVEVPAGGGDEFGGDEYGEAYDPYGADADGGSIPEPVKRRSSAGAGSSAAAERTKLPAIFLMVVCGLSVLFSMFEIAIMLLGLANGNPLQGNGPPPGMDPRAFEIQQTVGVVGGFVIFGLLGLKDIFLIFSASRMLAGRSYALAFAGAVIAVIPCIGSPCCALGIPFGIWALVVLNDPAVKAAFRP